MTAPTTEMPEMPEELRQLPVIDRDSIREGDLVFGTRPGLLRRLCATAGEIWRHVGIAVMIDSPNGPVMGMVEVDGDRFETRPISKVCESYDWLAVARVADGFAVQHAVDWARYMIGARHTYAFDDAVLAGFVALTRFHVGDVDPELAARIVRRAGRAASPRWTDRRITHTCSSFVYFAFNSGNAEDRLVVDLEVTQKVAFEVMSSNPVPAMRALRGARMNRQQLVEAARVVVGAIGGGVTPEVASKEAQGRWVMPGDLWRSPSIEFRGLVPSRR